MKPLALHQLVLSWVSIVPSEKPTSKTKRILSKITPLILIAGNLTGLTSSAIFFVRFVSTDLEASLYALFQISGQLGMTNAEVVTFFYRHKFHEMFKSLENIHNKCKNPIFV